MLNLLYRSLAQMCIFSQSTALIENKFMLHTDTTFGSRTRGNVTYSVKNVLLQFIWGTKESKNENPRSHIILCGFTKVLYFLLCHLTTQINFGYSLNSEFYIWQNYSFSASNCREQWTCESWEKQGIQNLKGQCYVTNFMKILTVRPTIKLFETFKKILKTLKEGINNTANTILLGTGGQTWRSCKTDCPCGFWKLVK